MANENVVITNNTFETDSGITGNYVDVQSEQFYQNPKLGYLDEVEDDCWELFKKYASFVGFNIDEESEIDFSIAKSISEKVIAEAENTFGIKFPSSQMCDEQSDISPHTQGMSL